MHKLLETPNQISLEDVLLLNLLLCQTPKELWLNARIVE
jgi:hypothetical protein